ncbi:MAG: hypothetical protein HOM88_03370 [Hellea sp.]|jgi:uncharacterized protein YcfJ|nr:hypothetical protein [Hellea sp.]
MKNLVFLTALTAATPVFANETPTNVRVYDHTKQARSVQIVEKLVCNDVKVPIYETVQSQGDAAGGALAGMIIGGLLGKGVSGNDDGAAVGAVIGGLVGADKGSQPKTQQRIVGYEWTEQCDVVEYRDTVNADVYSHSTIRFFIDGKRYVLNFQR